VENKLEEFLSKFQSLIINSLDDKVHPFSSYAPFIKYKNKYYVFLSFMAKHSHNLKENPKSSILFCEDEKDAENIFARKRVVFQTTAKSIEKNSDYELEVLDIFEERFETIKMLRTMSDFHLYEFTPIYGEAVFGFGAAYNIGGDNFDTLLERKGSKGHGHKKED
jgi:putative heme iron utilization protein